MDRGKELRSETIEGITFGFRKYTTTYSGQNVVSSGHVVVTYEGEVVRGRPNYPDKGCAVSVIKHVGARNFLREETTEELAEEDGKEVEVTLDEVKTTRDGIYFGSGTFNYKGTRNWKDSYDGVTFTKKGLISKEINAIEEALTGDTFTTYTPEHAGESRWITIYL